MVKLLEVLQKNVHPVYLNKILSIVCSVWYVQPHVAHLNLHNTNT